MSSVAGERAFLSEHRLEPGETRVKLTSCMLAWQEIQELSGMHTLRCNVFFISLLLITILPPVAAAERCDGLAPDAKDRIAAQLNEAEMALELGDLELAYQRVSDAGRPSAVVDISLDTECMGPALRERHYRVRKKVTLAAGREAENSGEKQALQNAVGFYIAGDNRKETTRLLNERLADARDASIAGNRLRWKLDMLQRTVDNGHELVAEQRAAPAFYQARLQELIERSESEANGLLSRENNIVNGPITDREEQISSLQQNAQLLQGSLVNDEDLSNDVDKEMLIASSRASASYGVLGDARQWLAWIEADAVRPVHARAEMRGDALLKRADDSDIRLESRDRYYDDAISYYKFAGAKQKMSAAEKSREAMQPALLAARQDREQRMESKLGELREAAEDFKRSTEMSAEDKTRFKSEADALEAELGF